MLEDLEALGAVLWVEDKKIMVPHDEKTKQVVIEPFLTDQWFVNAEVLAKPALASVREGAPSSCPRAGENTYFAWMENIKPWCISRQLWWGHQIPAWYGPRVHTDPDFGKLDAGPEDLRRRDRGRSAASRPSPITAARSRCTRRASARRRSRRPSPSSSSTQRDRPNADGLGLAQGHRIRSPN